jgi:hypothetical protein
MFWGEAIGVDWYLEKHTYSVIPADRPWWIACVDVCVVFTKAGRRSRTLTPMIPVEARSFKLKSLSTCLCFSTSEDQLTSSE